MNGGSSRTPEEIRASIEATRQELGTSVEALGSRVRDIADWRRHVNNNRRAAIAVAVAAGFVVGLALRGRSE